MSKDLWDRDPWGQVTSGSSVPSFLPQGPLWSLTHTHFNNWPMQDPRGRLPGEKDAKSRPGKHLFRRHFSIPVSAS